MAIFMPSLIDIVLRSSEVKIYGICVILLCNTLAAEGISDGFKLKKVEI